MKILLLLVLIGLIAVSAHVGARRRERNPDATPV